jgi:hypothetical protein
MYRLAESFLKKQRNIIIILSVMMPAIIFGTFFVLKYSGNMPVDLSFILIFSLILILIIEITIIITYKITMKKYKNLTIEISENKIIRTNEKYKEEFGISDIKKMTVYKLKNNDIFSIRINFENSAAIFIGFDNISNLCDEIAAKIPNKEIIISKIKIINQMSPLYFVIVFILSFSFVIALTIFNKNLMEVFKFAVWIGLGIMFLFFKPTSRVQGKRFRLFEIILGSLFIFLSIFSILLELIRRM